ncbi:MAG TPA: GNAT family protein [Pedobacter sp.]
MKTEILSEDLILQNQGVLLLPFGSGRTKELKKIIFRDEIWRYMGMYIRTDQDFDNYVRDTLIQKKDGLCYPFLIVDKTTNKVAGSTRYGNINTASHKCEIGWTWYGKEFQGTGLNKAAKYELLRFGFETIGFKRIQFSADLENLRSRKAIEKLGAKQEGVFRNNYVDSDGKSKDDVYFSIITEEWDELKLANFAEFEKV